MSLRRRVLAVLAVVGLAACSGPSAVTEGSLPGSDHVHALRVAEDGSLYLGLHGALWRSTDGTDWEQAGLEGQDAMALGVVADGAPLLVGGHDVLARSTDGGDTFDMLSPDLPSLDIHALAQAPSDPAVVYAYVVGSGIFRSDDAGDTWRAAAAVGDQLPADLAALAVDPSDPSTVLAGSASAGVFRSTDDASTFVQTAQQGTVGLAFGENGQALAATGRGIDRSDDAGVTWTNVASGEQFAGQPLAVAIGPDDTAWAITGDPRVLYRRDGDSFDEVARA